MPDSPRRPLTAAQRGIWFGQQLAPDSPAYNTADVVEIRGELDTALLVESIYTCLTETEGLRAVFGVGEEPWQETGPLPVVRVLDLSTEADPRATAAKLLAEDLATPVRLDAGPLTAQFVLRVGPAEHWWWQRAHHIAVDGFSCALLLRRVAELHTAQAEGREPAPALTSVTAALSVDAAYANSPQRVADREFWLAELTDAPAPVSLSTMDFNVGAGLALRLAIPVPADLADALKATATRLSRTWPELAIAAVAGLTARRLGVDEVRIGLPVLARSAAADMRIAGTLMNIVPLRLPTPPGVSLAALAESVADQLRRTRPHHRYRHEDLRRDTGGAGLFGPVVNVLPFATTLRFGAAEALARNVSAGPVEDLCVAFRQQRDGLWLELDAHPERYTAAELTALQEELLTLLSHSAAEPKTPLRPAAGPGAWRLDSPAAPPLYPLAEVFTHDLGTIAVIEGDREWTYGQLWAGICGVAEALRHRGIRRGDLVAVDLPRGGSAVITFLGVLQAGAAYLPLDPAAPPARRQAVLADAKPALVLTAPDVAALAPAPARAPWCPAPHDLAYVIYTSGTTGTPKGVAIEHGALSAFLGAAASRYRITARDRVLQFAPLHFDASVEEVYLALGAGARLVVRTEGVESVAALLAECAAAGITVLDLPTGYWHELAYAVCAGELSLPPSVRLVIIGGEAAAPEWVRRWRTSVPGVALVNSYGPTETTVVATTAVLSGPA
ncbi:AMP-binding protein [Crossiella cryophila]|uniref:Non-ribosomal peptide synthetase component F n=1 Tax=Crossiella cryophila TaxID=43355 RepID=A0A7W7FWW9_9PSEU|nr:AMP-binding protein [Crossiella cryophila]MBB4680033.1 non-ribosomal peptide synthetase component F [Crossiella cryophila]